MSNRNSMALVLALAFGIAIAQPSWAASPRDALEAFFGGTNAILRSADAENGTEAPRQAIQALVNEIFDYQDAAARALGPAWHSRTPSEQAEFVRLFADFFGRGFIALVGTKANVSGGLQILYLEERITGDSAAVATTLLTRAGTDLDVDYFMVWRDGRWMVRDVVVDGVSLIANYRAQFNRILSTSSYTDLVARMQGETPAEPQPAVAAADTVVQVAMGETAPAAAPQSAEPASPAAVVEPAAVAPPAARQEVQLAARSVEVAASRADVIRVRAPEHAISVEAAPKAGNGVVASHYWVQVGAFKTEGAAAQLAERLRRQGMAASNEPLTSAPGHPAGALARVRVGPFTTPSDARSKLRELMARGYAPFIAEARN